MFNSQSEKQESLQSTAVLNSSSNVNVKENSEEAQQRASSTSFCRQPNFTSESAPVKKTQTTPPSTTLPSSKLAQTQKTGQDKTTRISLACMLCRRKKIKCDSNQPQCQNCKNRGAQCIYAKERKRGRPPRVYTYGDLIPPGKPIAPELQSAIEEAILNSKSTNMSQDTAFTPDTSSKAPKSSLDDRKQSPLTFNASENKVISANIPDSPGLSSDEANLSNYSIKKKPLYPIKPYSGQPFPKKPLSQSQNESPGLFQKSLKEYDYESKFFPQKRTSSFNDSYSRHVSHGLNPNEYPPIEMNNLVGKFASTFLPHIPIFNRTALLEKIQSKSIGLPLWLVICAMSAEYRDYRLRCAYTARRILLLDDRIGNKNESIYTTLQHLQSLLLLSIYFFYASKRSLAINLHSRAVDLMLSKNFNFIDLKKYNAEGSLPHSRFSEEVYSSPLQRADKITKEEIRRTCWMIYVFDRFSSNISFKNTLILSESMLIRLPKTKSSWDFFPSAFSKNSDSRPSNSKKAQPTIARSFYQSFLRSDPHPTSSKPKSLVQSKQNNLENISRCVILYYIENALVTEMFTTFARSVSSKLIAPISLNNVRSSVAFPMKLSNTFLSHNSTENVFDPHVTLPRSNSSTFTFPLQPNRSPNEIRDIVGSYLNIGTLYTQINTWLNYSRYEYDSNVSPVSLMGDQVASDNSSMTNVMIFGEKITQLGPFLQAQILVAITAFLEISYEDLLFKYSTNGVELLDYISSTMCLMMTHESLDEPSFSRYENEILNSFKSQETASNEGYKYNILTQFVSLILGGSFSYLFITDEFRAFYPIMTKSIIQVLFNRTSEILYSCKNSKNVAHASRVVEIITSSHLKPTISASYFGHNLGIGPNTQNTQGHQFSPFPGGAYNDLAASKRSHEHSVDKPHETSILEFNSSKLNFGPDNASEICLESWKKCTELALVAAAACADLARIIAFNSVLSIDLAQPTDDSISSKAFDHKYCALESLRYNFHVPVVILGSIRVLLTNYKMYKILYASRACLLGKKIDRSQIFPFKLKKVCFSPKINSPDKAQEKTGIEFRKIKPAVWNVCEVGTEYSVNSNESDKFVKQNSSISAMNRDLSNKPRKSQLDYIESILTPCSLLDVLHGLGALLSLTESASDFWDLDKQLIIFEKIINEIQNEVPIENNDKSDDSSLTNVNSETLYLDPQLERRSKKPKSNPIFPHSDYNSQFKNTVDDTGKDYQKPTSHSNKMSIDGLTTNQPHEAYEYNNNTSYPRNKSIPEKFKHRSTELDRDSSKHFREQNLQSSGLKTSDYRFTSSLISKPGSFPATNTRPIRQEHNSYDLKNPKNEYESDSRLRYTFDSRYYIDSKRSNTPQPSYEHSGVAWKGQSHSIASQSAEPQKMQINKSTSAIPGRNMYDESVYTNPALHERPSYTHPDLQYSGLAQIPENQSETLNRTTPQLFPPSRNTNMGPDSQISKDIHYDSQKDADFLHRHPYPDSGFANTNKVSGYRGSFKNEGNNAPIKNFNSDDIMRQSPEGDFTISSNRNTRLHPENRSDNNSSQPLKKKDDDSRENSETRLPSIRALGL
ncbi:hypothetical protein BB560_000272 [Smittium megazygosporum]|uniref:Zn(2)-C6 fungal-type domain-containing protein n=1 Tax=Smittium megazygosporum TaxID=133381 RepID=A0A2T9ZKW3_9FUNG|nr:hypothetical protein BB560_000272 [Smittium megazygosporum]